MVILGAGFGGLSAAQTLLRSGEVDLTVIDAQNHHLFQPLLYQVATAALSPTDIAAPLRDVIHAAATTRVVMGAVTGIDTRERLVSCVGREVPYDELIVATGSQPSYYGHDEWAKYAPGLKTLHDALDLRGRLLLAFEHACTASDEAERNKLLTFVLIGGGPTGVEMAGSIAELTREMLASDHELGDTRPRIVLLEGGGRLLAEFAPDLSANAEAALVQLGVEVHTDTKVTSIEDGLVRTEHETIETSTIVWAAGTTATAVAAWLKVKPSQGGRVEVDADLRVVGQPRIHVIGDAALARDANGKALPSLAPVAKQQGVHVARAIIARTLGRKPPASFRYRDYGTMATIGRAKGVAEFGPLHVTGWPAWSVWAVAHIFFLIGFRNRFMVSSQWAIAFATDRRPGRLITWSPDVRDAPRTGAARHTAAVP